MEGMFHESVKDSVPSCVASVSDHQCSSLHSKDPNKPKRAMSAFFLYSQAFRTKVKTTNPDASFGDVVSRSTLCRLRFCTRMSVLSVWVACMLCLKCCCDCQSDVCIHCVVFRGVEFCVCEIVSTDAAVAFHRDTER